MQAQTAVKALVRDGLVSRRRMDATGDVILTDLDDGVRLVCA